MTRYLFILLFPFSLFATEKYKITTFPDWKERLIRISLEVPINKVQIQSRRIAETSIIANSSIWVPQSIESMIIDSKHRLSDFWGIPPFINPLNTISPMLEMKEAIFSQDFKHYKINYTLKLYPSLINLWLTNYKQKELPKTLKSFPNRDYSGLIIYAKGLLPLHGLTEKGHLEPAIFPKIYDENLNLILSKDNVSSDFLKKWGVVQYEEKIKEFYNNERIGREAYAALALSLFGSNKTDVIIPNKAVEIFLSTQHNRRMLQEGRIMIVTDLPGKNVIEN